MHKKLLITTSIYGRTAEFPRDAIESTVHEVPNSLHTKLTEYLTTSSPSTHLSRLSIPLDMRSLSATGSPIVRKSLFLYQTN